VGKREGKRPLGRPRRRWEDGIRMDLGLGGVDWIRLTQDRDRWRAVVSAVKFSISGSVFDLVPGLSYNLCFLQYCSSSCEFRSTSSWLPCRFQSKLVVLFRWAVYEVHGPGIPLLTPNFQINGRMGLC
jgi:hypothetical protein